jgi:Flp pilus assembly pilin Flp
MLNVLSGVRQTVAKLHRSEQGAEGLEKLLIISAIALPLLGVLLIFRKSIQDWVYSAWSSMLQKDAAVTAPGDPGAPANP